MFEKELKYSITDCFNEFEEVRKLALLPDAEGNYKNLSAASKAIENKGRLAGAFIADNEQKNPKAPIITVASQADADLIKEIQNVKADKHIS